MCSKLLRRLLYIYSKTLGPARKFASTARQADKPQHLGVANDLFEGPLVQAGDEVLPQTLALRPHT
eukprot:5137186-Alexandrium_andersonii.AAC.1